MGVTSPGDVPAGAGEAKTGPLDGVRVLDLSMVVSGPLCARILSDLGADVIKVEPPTQDHLRFVVPQIGDDGVAVYYTWVNAGKRAITVDIRTPEGCEILRQLALSSDVVLENFRPGVLERYGLDAETLRAAEPRLVYCSINGWGASNSWSQRRAYAAMVQAEVGRVELDARLRDKPAELSPHVEGDTTAGLLAVSGLLAALYRRERTGVGDHIDVSMAEALLYTDEWTGCELIGYEGPRIPDTWLYPVVETADGTQAVFAGNPHKRFVEIAAALSDEPIEPTDNYEDSVRIVRELASRIPDFATLEARLEVFSFFVGEVRSVTELADSAWARERDVFREVEPGHHVTVKPFHSDNSAIAVRGRAPRFAEHTREVLAERLDLDDAELDALEERGAILSREKLQGDGLPHDLTEWRARRRAAHET
jgi:CoA:oxalate CoA-transferase